MQTVSASARPRSTALRQHDACRTTTTTMRRLPPPPPPPRHAAAVAPAARAPAAAVRRAAAAAAAAVPAAPIIARFGGGRGGLLDKPDVEIKTGGPDLSSDSWTATPPKTETGGSGGSTEKSKTPGGGAWRVLLIDHERHVERNVVAAILSVVPNTDKAHAENCFHTSRQLGLAIITSCLKEHAEFYRQQLHRYRVKTSIEPDLSA